MPLIPRLTSLWRNLFHKDRVDQEFTEEIQAYLDMLTEASANSLKPRGETFDAACGRWSIVPFSLQ